MGDSQPVSMPEITTKRRPGRPKKNSNNSNVSLEIVNSLFSAPARSSELQDDSDNASSEDHADIDPRIPIAQDINTAVDKVALDSGLLEQDSGEVNKMKDGSKNPFGLHTWASKLKPCAKGMSLSYVESSTDLVQIDMNDIQSEISFWKHTLVGAFIGSRHNLTGVQSYVKQFWNSVTTPEVLYFKKGWYYFKFANETDCLSILHGGPWIFGNSTLLLKQWTPDFCSHLDSVKVIPVWTLLNDLDPCFWSHSALSKIASIIGKPLFADPYTTDKTRISFARVLIDIDVSKDLPSSIKIDTPFGTKMISIEYEWIPHFCTICDCIGHSTQKCRKNAKKENRPTVTKQVWRPIEKNMAPEPHAEIQLVMENQSRVIEKETDISGLANKAVAAGVSQPEGFNSVRRRSRSPPKTADILEIHKFNSFAVLEDMANTSDSSLMEGGGAPQIPP